MLQTHCKMLQANKGSAFEMHVSPIMRGMIHAQELKIDLHGCKL